MRLDFPCCFLVPTRRFLSTKGSFFADCPSLTVKARQIQNLRPLLPKDLSMSGTETLVPAAGTDQQPLPPAPKSPTKRAERKWYSPGGARRGGGGRGGGQGGPNGRRWRGTPQQQLPNGHQSDNNTSYQAFSPKPQGRRYIKPFMNAHKYLRQNSTIKLCW